MATKKPAKKPAAKKAAAKKPAAKKAKAGLDGRKRDANGQISHKHGNTLVKSLREEYGENFAKGHRGDMKLSTLLEKEGVESLHQYLKKHHM